MCFPNRTMCGSQTGQCVFSKQDNACFPNKTMCGSQTGQCVLPKQDNVCFSNRTMCGFQQKQCVVPKHENRKDASDFDDFLTKTITTTQTFFFQFFASSKFSRRRKICATSAPACTYTHLYVYPPLRQRESITLSAHRPPDG